MKRYLKNLPDLTGKRAVVTGYGGIGYAAAYAFAAKGASVILAGRTPRKGEAAAARIQSELPEADVIFEELDLADLDSVRDFARRMTERGGAVDLLMCIAGVMMPDGLQLTKQGFEMQFGVNYLGHYALTGLLLPLLRKGRDARVITVSSIANRPVKFDFADARGEHGYSASRSYAFSKLCCLMFAPAFQAHSDRAGWGVKAVAVHPGLARTQLFNRSRGFTMTLLQIIFTVFPFIRQSAGNASRPALYAASSPDAKPGGYYGPWFAAALGGPHKAATPGRAKNPKYREALWTLSEELTGIVYV
ncbi:MAG: SDR family NAD(P)-dependent oxidoreductase [Clostridiales Family XIII bacterium]|jgi:NAD(P)-dependent dehydrogenase (short-subunit alcohol dehydrogenase family)|nr:SDR family NAD(P)-dependent oxidoreductase [Clostridiales Family XIII bacterium]